MHATPAIPPRATELPGREITSYYSGPDISRLELAPRTRGIVVELFRQADPAIFKALASQWQRIDSEVPIYPWKRVLGGVERRFSAPEKMARNEVLALSMRPSNTLDRDPAAVKRWEAARSKVFEWADQGLEPNTKRIVELGHIIDRENGRTLRKKSFGKDGTWCVEPEDLAWAMKHFEQWYHRNKENFHPIALAALTFQWLATIHPINNGNGRTGRLVRDWVLLLHEYPPLAVLDADRGNVHPWNGMGDSPEEAIQGTTKHLMNTLEILRRNLGPGGMDWRTERRELIKRNHLEKGDSGEPHKVLLTSADGRKYRTVDLSSRRERDELTKTIFRPINFIALEAEALLKSQAVLPEISEIFSAFPVKERTLRVIPAEELKSLAFRTGKRYTRGDWHQLDALLNDRIEVNFVLKDHQTCLAAIAHMAAHARGFSVNQPIRWEKDYHSGFAQIGDDFKFSIVYRVDRSKESEVNEWFRTKVLTLHYTEHEYRVRMYSYLSALHTTTSALFDFDPGPGIRKMPDPQSFKIRPSDIFRYSDESDQLK